MVTSSGRCFAVDDLDAETAVFAEPVACVVHGLDVLGLRPGATVLLFGAGPTELILTQLLAGSGANELTVAAPTQAKLDLARVRGADRTVLTAITQLVPSRTYAKPPRTGSMWSSTRRVLSSSWPRRWR